MDKQFPLKFATLKREIEPLQAQRAEYNKRHAPGFDVLNILGIERQESTHSKFLVHLLNPTESHAQGTLFLKQFLARLGITDALTNPARFERIQVESEFIIKGGRLDLLIRIPPGYVILIENKIDSDEGKDQLKRYQTWLSTQPETHKVLVYLTPFGGDCDDRSLSAKPTNWLSYGSDVAEWLDSCKADLNPGSRLYGFLIAYIDRAKQIGGAAMDQDDELTKFLLRADNILAAYDVWESFSQVQDTLRLAFWRVTAEKLRSGLSLSKWTISIHSDDDLLTDDWPTVMMEPPGRNEEEFCVKFAVQMNKQTKKVFYGVCYSDEVKRNSSMETRLQRLPLLDKLKENLRNDDMNLLSTWWPGYRYIEGINLQEKATLLTLARDDTLQSRTADRLLELFHKYEGPVSAINAALRSGGAH